MERTFASIAELLLVRKTALLEEIANLTRTERDAIETDAAVKRQHWMTLQSGVALTGQLLDPTSSALHVGHLAKTVVAHLRAAARQTDSPTPEMEEIRLVIEPGVFDALKSLGRLHFLRAHAKRPK